MSIDMLSLARRLLEQRRAALTAPTSPPLDPVEATKCPMLPEAAVVELTSDTALLPCVFLHFRPPRPLLDAPISSVIQTLDDADCPPDLSVYKVGPIPSLYYVNDVLDGGGATALLAAVDSYGAAGRWVSLRNRRLQRWGGVVLSDGLHSPEVLPQLLQDLAQQLVAQGVFDSEHTPNHVLINEYHSGQGIMPHTDGPAYHPKVATLSIGSDALMYLSRPATSSVPPMTPVATDLESCSRGGCACEDTAARRARHLLVGQLLLRANSLVVFTDVAYTDMLHCIDDALEETVDELCPCFNVSASGCRVGDVIERGLRVSLTIRHVPLATQPSGRSDSETPADEGNG